MKPNGVLVCVLSALCAVGTASAGFAEADILADSALVLAESSAHGSYATKVVSVESVGGTTTLRSEIDGKAATAVLSSHEVLALWRALNASGIESLANEPGTGLAPDQSHFTISWRVGSAGGTFTVYGVDQLPDPRYRAIVREVEHLSDVKAYGRTWRK